MDEVASSVKLATPTANIRTVVLDLASLASVRAAAKEVCAYPEPIHVCHAAHSNLYLRT